MVNSSLVIADKTSYAGHEIPPLRLVVERLKRTYRKAGNISIINLSLCSSLADNYCIPIHLASMSNWAVPLFFYPYSESLYKTLKYRPWYPQSPFKGLEEARDWVEDFAHWYNLEHRHSRLEYVTPNQRHTGQDKLILAHRRAVYQRAKNKNPERWSGQTRQWTAPAEVILNKQRTSTAEEKAA